MSALMAVALAALQLASAPLVVEAQRDAGVLVVRLELTAPLPEPLEAALPSGAQVSVEYALRLRAPRRMLWDRRVWRGTVRSTVAFDPVTGRYRCELILDTVLVASEERPSATAAHRWLQAPPVLRLALPPRRHDDRLRLRARAIFSHATTWLVFPSSDGTDWVEVPVGRAP